MENISEEFDRQLSNTLRSENGNGTGSRLIQLRPTTTNIVSGSLSGDIIYQYMTGATEFVDLSKCYQVLRCTFSATTDFIHTENLLDNAFNRMNLYLNGKWACGSNNSQDAGISKRICKGKGKNIAYGQIEYHSDGAASATHPGDGTQEYCNGLDALFLNTGKSIFLPPGTDIRFVFSVDTNMLAKSSRGDGVDSTTTLTVNDLFMRFASITTDLSPPKNYVVKFLTIDSFKTSVNSATHYQQVQVRPNIVKVGCVFQDTTADTTSLTKAYDCNHFTWETDGDAEADELHTLYFKAGSLVIPAERLDMSTYGRNFAYNDYIFENHMDSVDYPESFANWRHQGPVFCYKIVKTPEDIIQTIELNATFKAQPTALSILFAVYEQVINFEFEITGNGSGGRSSAIPAGTTTAI